MPNKDSVFISLLKKHTNTKDKINIMVTRRRPGKSDLVNDILRIMKMNVPFKIGKSRR